MTNWKEELTGVGALWHHDGHPDRPYALLTSDRISGDFADTTFAMAKPSLIAKAAIELARKVKEHYPDIDHTKLVICGQQEGSTTLASRIAEELDCGFVYTTKVGEGADKKMVLADRFAGIFREGSFTVLVEDVSTTAGTSAQSRVALDEADFQVSENLLTLVDRTGGSNDHGFNVVSCYTPDNFPTWPEGENPHTPDGKELVAPVRPKSKANRAAMRQVLP